MKKAWKMVTAKSDYVLFACIMSICFMLIYYSQTTKEKVLYLAYTFLEISNIIPKFLKDFGRNTYVEVAKRIDRVFTIVFIIIVLVVLLVSILGNA